LPPDGVASSSRFVKILRDFALSLPFPVCASESVTGFSINSFPLMVLRKYNIDKDKSLPLFGRV
jgi:hypothetical protein